MIVNNKRFNIDRIAQLIAFVSKRPCTTIEIAAHMRCSRSSIRRWTKALHAAKCLHIHCYAQARDGCFRSIVWAWGPGKDEPKPEVPSATERVQKSRRRAASLDVWRGVTI